MATGLELPPTKYAESLFDFFDRDHSGTIDFIEFMYGLSLFAPDTPEEARRRLAFRLYDKDARGQLRLANIEEVLACTHDRSQMCTLARTHACTCVG